MALIPAVGEVQNALVIQIAALLYIFPSFEIGYASGALL